MADKTSQAQPRVVVCLYDLTLWLLQRTNRFPRNWRVTLGDAIDRLAIRMTTTAQMAGLRKDKRTLLSALSDDLEILRTLTRLSRDLECLDLKQYEHAARQMAEIGRQLGGWLKQQAAR